MSILEWLPWIRERRTDALADEIRAHLEMAQADRVDRGESPSEAAANVRREFGNVALVQEVSRDEWGTGASAFERLTQDVRFALRILRRAPGFATVTILTIALGIGATAAIFSVVDATILRPLPYPKSHQLVRIEDDLLGVDAHNVGMSTPEWRDLARSGIFEYVSPTWFDDNNLTGVSHAQRVGLLIVAPNYFTMLGVKPQLGVTFDPADATPGFNGQAVISDGLWKRAFGGAHSVLGRVVQLDSDSYRIVGVMPPGFQAPEQAREAWHTEVWVAFGFAGAPLSPSSAQSRRSLFPGAIARIAPNLTVAGAQQRVDVLVQELRRRFPGDYPPRSDWHVRLVPLRDHVIGDVREPLLFLLGAVTLVLLIACANVANLLLARSTTRGREMALRQALGGAPARLTRQLLTESVVLSAIGGVVGILILFVVKDALVKLVPVSVPRVNDITIDWGMLLFALGVSCVAGIVFGLAPAWQVRRVDVNSVLKLEGRGSTSPRDQQRLRRLLVVSEFALALVLMSAAGLLARSFRALLDAPLGFDPAGVTVLRTRLPYPNDSTEDLYPNVEAEAPFVRDLIRRARLLPGVEEVALGSGAAVPLDHPEQDQTTLRVQLEGDVSHGDQPLLITGSQVTPEYFHLLGMTLRRGRLIDAFDAEGQPPVAVINDAMARTYWPNEDPLGKRFRRRSSDRWTTVVGVVANARTESLANAAVPHVYVSLYQRQGKHLAIFVRGHVESGTLARQIGEVLHSLNPALPLFHVESLNAPVASWLAVRRFSLELIGLFALTALSLAALGIYGVISHMVGERRHEIGVRIALGAQGGNVMAMVLRQGVRLAGTGVAIGLVGTLIVSHAMAHLLVGVTPTDPLTMVVGAGVLAAVAIVGCYVPARRAIRVDPMVALR